MASMYNPSKVVTELLEEYIEFDPEQLKLGIWSGHLSLNNVHLRQEAIYPLLNSYQQIPQPHDGETAQLPPLRFKLLSGTIGALDIRIPWKRLVWRQGDVRVDLKQVVLVLALETRQETCQRYRELQKQKEKKNEADSSGDSKHEEDGEEEKPKVVTFWDEMERLEQQQHESGPCACSYSSQHERKQNTGIPELGRKDKQKRLAMAEMRHLQGRPLGSWLTAMRQRDEQDHAKTLRENARLANKKALEQDGTFISMLREATQNFFWRLWAGLHLNIENLKIVLVQDGVEVGLVIPQAVGIAPADAKDTSSGIFSDSSSDDNTMGVSASGAPQNLDYRGAHEDGEHLDKSFHIEQIGVYVRKQVNSFHAPPESPIHMPVADIHASEYVLRPLDVEFSFSLFFPYPAEKRKKIVPKPRHASTRSASSRSFVIEEGSEEGTEAEYALEQTESKDTYMSSPPQKRRRKKRDKASSANETAATENMSEAIAPSVPSLPSPKMGEMERASSVDADHPLVRLGMNMNDTPDKPQRRTSLFATPAEFSSIKSVRPLQAHQRSTSTPLPLARPDDYSGLLPRSSQMSMVPNDSTQPFDICARFEGKLAIGAVQMVWSTRHYELMNAFLAGGARLRNGRPNTTIHSVLNQGQVRQRVLTVTSAADREVRLELRSARTERSEVIVSWWRYALGALVWQIRQRRRLRQVFQERFLSFNWKQQRRYRDEYVRLFIRLRLVKKEWSPLLGDNNASGEERLLSIEDELPVEQILLYRSLARNAHVLGQANMPDSILELQCRVVIDVPKANVARDEKSGSVEDLLESHLKDEDGAGLLSFVEEQCEIARLRKGCPEDEDLPRYDTSRNWSSMARQRALPTEVDETTFASAFTRDQRVKMRAVAVPAEESSSMVVSFSVKVKEVELLVVEEEPFPIQYRPPPLETGRSSPPSYSSEASDVSVLTDDKRFFLDESGHPVRVDRSESYGAEPEPDSTDFLFFGLPERTILRLVLSPLHLTVAGKSGEFHRIKFLMGQVKVCGQAGREIVVMGEEYETSAPIHEISLSKSSSVHSMSQTPSSAVTLSWIQTRLGTTVQCDAATVRLHVDLPTIEKIVSFTRQTSTIYPSPLVGSSPRDEVRLYVIRQYTHSTFSAVNASMRFYGFEMILPSPKEVQRIDGSSGLIAEDSPTCVFRSDMVEIYSGKTLDAIAGDSGSDGDTVLPAPNDVHDSKLSLWGTLTRKLQMIDVSDFRPFVSDLCHGCVVAISGLDIVARPKGTDTADQLSLLQNQIDMEVLLALNSYSVLEPSRAKVETTVKISAVDFVLSESRLLVASECLGSGYLDRSSPEQKLPVSQVLRPPRLEVLSSFATLTADVSVSRFRVSILGQDYLSEPTELFSKHLEREDIISDFLSVVSNFDLSFPHEEALSAAMQICIDRLSGLGLSSEDAWRIANSALLNFLEEVTGARAIADKDGRSSTVEETQELVEDARQKALVLTISKYSDLFGSNELIERMESGDLVIDCPDGVSFSTVSLFYDSHTKLEVPTIFVLNGGGVHILRVTPPGSSVSDGSSSGSRSSSSQSRDFRSEQSQLDSNAPPAAAPSPFGLTIHQFSLDKETPFGRGGLPLAILGSDSDMSRASDARVREHLYDINVGELELFFCRSVACDVASMLVRTFAPLSKLNSAGSGPSQSPRATVQGDGSHFLGVCGVASVLLASDSFVPFSRVALRGAAARSSVFTDSAEVGNGDVGIPFHASSFEVFDLSPDSVLYPSVVSVLAREPGRQSLPVVVTYKSSVMEVVLNGIRVVFLRRFLNEVLQYFNSETHGIGGLLEILGGTEDSDNSNSLRCTISLVDSSILLPRSSSSADMIAIEPSSLTVDLDEVHSSFVMPTGTRVFSTGGAFDEESVNTSDQGAEFADCRSRAGTSVGTEGGEIPPGSISRVAVCLRGVRLFTSLPETGDPEPGPGNLSFNYCYQISGRAGPDGNVYGPLDTADGIGMSEGFERENACRAQRCWREISRNELSLDVIADYAPHLRLLLASPRNGPVADLSLDVRLSQFCLLLSVWYSNMQELPSMFPFTVAELQSGSANVSDQFDFPDFGTEALVEMLLNPLHFSTEICVIVDRLALRCSFDCLDEQGCLIGSTPGTTLCFGRPVVHVTSDERGVGRIGVGSTAFSFTDESQAFEDVVTVPSSTDCDPWADLSFGLDSDQGLGGDIPSQAFQLTLFMIPSWSLYNMGMRAPKVTLTNFSPIFRVLEIFSSYFTDSKFGNPVLEAAELAENLKASLRKGLNLEERGSASLDDDLGGTDFRLWLSSPKLSVPCDPDDKSAPCLSFRGDGGLWYRYTSLSDVSIQEVVSDGLSLDFCDCAGINPTEQGAGRIRTLIGGLSFGIRMDFNGSSGHSDYSISIPFSSHGSCGIASERLTVPPLVVAPSPICVPVEKPHRYLGLRVCEITCLVEVFPAVSTAILALFSGPPEDVQPNSGTGRTDTTDDDASEERPSQSTQAVTEKENSSTFSLVASVGDFRFFVLDPILGPHLPIAVLSIANVLITASQFSHVQSNGIVEVGSSAPEDIQVAVEAHLWADYFKLGVTRSWEPLMESYSLSLLWEKSRLRGSGVCLSAESPLHFNISGALLVIMNQVVDVYTRLVQDTFSDGDRSSDSQPSSPPQKDQGNGPNWSVADILGDTAILHQKPDTVESHERVAFSLKNLTGQKLRLFRSGSALDAAAVSYVEHGRIARLSFQPSITTIRNMKVREVEFPGFSRQCEDVASHLIDLQLPGCKWLRGLEIGSFGRGFSRLSPLSSSLQKKSAEDWRLVNLLHVLIEVGLENGGRQVTVRSLFSVVNRTEHDISILCHPDPSFSPPNGDTVDSGRNGTNKAGHEEDAVVAPGESYSMPTLLLREALEQKGSHLGSYWLKPKNAAKAVDFENYSSEPLEDLRIDYSSRSVQLSRLVNESAVIFQDARSEDVPPDRAKTGVQISCPVSQLDGDRLAPFCYAVEVGRSPLVKRGNEPETNGRHCHGPVSYTMSIHAPFVFVNLLPKKARFELMHAVRKTIVWFADLDAGESVSVHSVGLDAPLLLLLNLGFCRTPVGEGALVHHGTDPTPGTKDHLGGLKSIGKAGKAVTKQLGKRLTAIGESPDKRVHYKMNKARTLKLASLSRPTMSPRSGSSENLDAQGDGKTYRIDTSVFFPHDVSDETIVVDSLGQRLSLSIENVRGGGGQRRVSVFCPYWIVNTTEHALRYKQENSKAFVAGTVLGERLEPATGQRSGQSYEVKRPFASTAGSGSSASELFSGTPGALASKLGRTGVPSEEIAELIDFSLPLDKLAETAFMFNFHEGMTIGSHRLCIQLGDGTVGSSVYQSDFSRGLSLDSVGISQMVSLHCMEGRYLELTVLVYVAPGALSNYTKIVRLLPRYVVVNTLPYPVRLWQDSSVFRSVEGEHGAVGKADDKWRYGKGANRIRGRNQYESLWGREATLDEGFAGTISGTTAHTSALYIATIGPSDLVPFLLPDSRDERQLRIDVGAPWNLTASFAADISGDHVLELTKGVDLKTLPHVSTRASPEYQVTIHPGSLTDEMGVWYETEWGSSRSVIVKAVKKNSFAFNETDINVGDELLQIDSTSVAMKTFAEVMETLRNRVHEISAKNLEGRGKMRRSTLRLSGRSSQASHGSAEVTAPLVLTFRTAEERLRRVRLKAARAAGSGMRVRISSSLPGEARGNMNPPLVDSSNDISTKHIRAELKTLHHMMFLVLREEESPPFLIQNRTVSGIIYFRQKGCASHSWRALKPEQSVSYTWQEPLKLKRLSIRIAPETAYQFVHDDRNPRIAKSEDEAAFSSTVNVKIEEIGFTEYLLSRTPGEDEQKWYKLEVDVSGATRILVIRDVSKENEQIPLTKHFDFLRDNIAEEEVRLDKLGSLNQDVVARAESDVEPVDNSVDFVRDAEETAKGLVQGLSGGPSIGTRHQVFVQVLEALNLNTDSFVGDCNPYASVALKSGTTRRRSLFRKVDTRSTYYVKKSVNPTWESQCFIFDVPPSAVEVPRGHSITVRIRSYRTFGQDHRLGKAQVDLHSLRDQEPLVGWFPLVGRTGRRDLENQRSHWGRGSVKLRLQWIYSVPALLNYFAIISQNRLLDLQTRLERLEEHAKAREFAEQQEKKEVDQFKLVRIQDLLSLSPKSAVRLGALNLKEQTKTDSKVPSKPFRPSKRNAKVEAIIPKHNSEPRKSPYANASAGNAKRLGAKGRSLMERDTDRRWSRLDQAISPQVVDNRSKHRLISEDLSCIPLDENMTFSNRNLASFEVPVSAITSWNYAQALFNDKEIETEAEGDVIVTQIRPASPRPKKRIRMEQEIPVAEKMELSSGCPGPLITFAKQQITLFTESRSAFERTARRSLSTILHPGGWLTIRPIQAMNLPDNYSGMFVRLRYGSEVLVTDSVDARVSPRWSPSPGESNTGDVIQGGPASTLFAEQPNDLHIHVAPQRTNGLIQLSVVGERSQQQLQARSELGALYVPLGSAIAACIDSETTNGSSVLHYQRWFPLLRPNDSVPVEGDGGQSFRAPDSEKHNERGFKDYYMPCIELALIWHPDRESEGFPAEDQVIDSGDIVPPDSHGRGVNVYFNADLASISAALLDSERNFELLSFNAMDFDVRFWITEVKTRMGVSIRWLQLDHQDEDAREPIVLAPTPNDSLFPVFHVFAVKDNLRSTEVVTFDFIDVSLAEFDLTIEESFIFDLVVFVNSFLVRRGIDRISRSEQVDHSVKSKPKTRNVLKTEVDAQTDEPSLSALLAGGFKLEESSSKVYIEQLFLGVVKVNLSYVKGARRSQWESTLKRGWSDTVNDPTRLFQQIAHAGEEKVRKQFGLHHGESEVFVEWSRQTSNDDQRAEDSDKALQNLPKLMSALFPNLSDAPVRLQSKALNHVFESPTEIMHSLKSFYVNETLKQVYKILGSLDFVGNPTMLVTSFFSGFRDLLVTPSAAFLKSPTDPSSVGLGVAKGTLSLVSHSTSGFFAFCARVSATAGQTIAAVSMDPDFREWHRSRIVVETTNLNRQWKRRGMQSVQAMIARPVGDLILGVFGGAFGIVLSPVKGYRRAGAPGMIRGVAIGCIGVIARPAVGVLDAFAHFTASIHDIAKSVNILDRRLQPATRIRLPYTFGFMNVLMPFDDSLARADFLLRSYPLEKSVKNSLEFPETIVHVEVLPNNAVVAYAIATTARVILIRVKKELSGVLTPSLCWELCFSPDTEVSSRVVDHGHSGVALTITLAKPPETMNETIETPRSLGVSENSFRLTPGLPSFSRISSRNLDPSSSDRPVLDVNADFDHHTGRGVKGEKLEWFTILAEYQYRRQLERLHNAICSVVGDFDSVIRDQSLGHHRGHGTEGYTSFGIYHFTPTDSNEVPSQASEQMPTASLERLLWVGERTFRETATKPPEQQRTVLDNMRQWGLDEYVEVYREEGGPEWMVSARARTMFTDATEKEEVETFCFDDGDLSGPRIDNRTSKNENPSVLTPFRPGALRRVVSWNKTATHVPHDGARRRFVRYEDPLASEGVPLRNPTPENLPAHGAEVAVNSFATPRSHLSESPAQGDKEDLFASAWQYDASETKAHFGELSHSSIGGIGDFAENGFLASEVFSSARQRELSRCTIPLESTQDSEAPEPPAPLSRGISDDSFSSARERSSSRSHLTLERSIVMQPIEEVQAQSSENGTEASDADRLPSRHSMVTESKHELQPASGVPAPASYVGSLDDSTGTGGGRVGERIGVENGNDDTFSSARERSSSRAHVTLDRSMGMPAIEEVPAQSPERGLDDKEETESGTRKVAQETRTPLPEDTGQPPSSDRMGRMETLMERLLVFSSEQVLLREQQSATETRAPPAEENEVALLRQEISNLRQELNRRAQSEINASEIAALREDVSWLRAAFLRNSANLPQPEMPGAAPDFNQQHSHAEDVD